MPVVQQAIQLRNSGVPKSVSEKVANSAFDVNREVWNWLRDIIDLTYEDPNLVINAFADGRLLEDCILKVRGF
jgi:phosphate uptake regulator